MKKALEIGAWILLFTGIITLLGFVGSAQHQKVCSNIRIDIDHSNGNYFIEEDDIYGMVYHEMDTLIGRPIDAINAEAMEYKINHHPAVAESEVYKTIDGELVVRVIQRTPIVRVFAYDGDSYYIDSTGSVMPPSEKFTSRVLIANGHIYDSFLDVNHLILNSLGDSLNSRTMVDDIFAYAEFIRKDPFWLAQIEQLYVNKEFDIELIPRVGNHRIVFGDARDIEKKFNKLKIFYTKGLNKTGWNEYKVINLKYSDQVVCTKRI